MMDSVRSLLSRATQLLEAHNNLFIVLLFGYGLVVFPWLRAEGFYELGVVIGVGFLGLMMLALRANVERARKRLGGEQDDERRGF